MLKNRTTGRNGASLRVSGRGDWLQFWAWLVLFPKKGLLASARDSIRRAASNSSGSEPPTSTPTRMGIRSRRWSIALDGTQPFPRQSRCP